MQRELTERRDLLGADSRIAEQGWAKSLILNYNRAQYKKNPIRLKEWDYYYVSDGEVGVAFTISDNGYMGLFSVSYLDFKSGEQITKTKISWFTMGKLKLPPTSEYGVTEIELPGLKMKFEKTSAERKISCHWPNFSKGEPFDADLTLTDFPQDSMVIATDFINSKDAFYYNQKINCQRAKGTVRIGDRTYDFAPGNSLGTLDWGRGVWSYQNTWYWGSLSARLPDGRTFGLNIGTGFANNTYATEDMLFVNGVATKLDKVRWDIPFNADGKENYMGQWWFESDCGKLKMTFRPILDRAAVINIGVLKTDQHQVFGYFSGVATTDDGEQIEFHDLLGFAEKVFNRY